MRKAIRLLTVLATLLLTQLPAMAAGLRDEAALDAWLDQSIRTTKIPGLVALVTDRQGVIYTHAAGERSRVNRAPMTADTIFNIASMTKPIGATAIMMLVEQGKLGLDDPISKYVPEFSGRQVIATFHNADASLVTRPAAREITIRHLLSHSSGLAYGFASERISRLSAARQGVDVTTFPLLYDPGSAWSYAGGIAVVGRVLERIEGKGLDVFLQERLFGPLGMSETAYVVPAALRARVAPPFRLTDGVLVESPLPAEVRSPVSADGGLYSTAADYARFIRLILNGGRAPDGRRLLSEESVRMLGYNHLGNVKVSLQDEPAPQLARAFPLGAGRDGFGLGFQVTGEPRQPGMRAPGSLSWAGIYNTEFWIDPVSGIGGVLLMQYLPFYDAGVWRSVGITDDRLSNHAPACFAIQCTLSGLNHSCLSGDEPKTPDWWSRPTSRHQASAVAHPRWRPRLMRHAIRPVMRRLSPAHRFLVKRLRVAGDGLRSANKTGVSGEQRAHLVPQSGLGQVHAGPLQGVELAQRFEPVHTPGQRVAGVRRARRGCRDKCEGADYDRPDSSHAALRGIALWG